MKMYLSIAASLALALCACSDAPEPSGNGEKDIPDTEQKGENKTQEALTAIPFSKGLNLSDWFNPSEYRWFNADTYSEKDFDNLKSLGVDVVRLPIHFPIFMGAAPDYAFGSDFLAALDKAISWAEARDMYVILDQHSYYGSRMFPESYGEALVTSGLRQLAERYRDKSDKIVYELFNEPGGTYLEQNWYAMQGRIIKAIREIDTTHPIIVCPLGNDITKLSAVPDYDDDRLIYSFHFYDPFVFTHQGANWDNSPLEHISNVEFPYNASTFPAKTTAVAADSWLSPRWDAYPAQGTEKYIGDVLMTAYSWAAQHNHLLFCGEFGTLNTAPSADRCRWYKAVTDYFAVYDIAWTAWEYRDTNRPNFGIFNGANIFESNLNVDLVAAMGLTVPAGYDLDCPSVVFFDDDIPFWWTQGSKWDGYAPQINFACKENPFNGSINCIRWDIDHEWGGLVMTAWPVADLTKQFAGGAKLEFAVRTTDNIDKLVVRFTQYKSGARWQWRNMTTIGTGPDAAFTFAADGEWHKVSIPLNSLQIKGTQGDWKDAPGVGEEGFAWDCVNHLEFVPEGNTSLIGKTICFDEIAVRKSGSAGLAPKRLGKKI